tara:strand:- start:280 stop:417 length:138 start_codon:yes stop_codon:yes gene_type:complete
MARKVTIHVFKGNKRRKRPGVHAKTKTSKSKHSQNYVKKYVGQGR